MKVHPEEYWDKIREYSSDGRYKPTVLETLLLDQAGYHCSICRQPYCEIHHIQHMEHGGKTEYENLIVLCPNCHTRVHQNGVPDSDQLKQIKHKQEIAYELPIRSRISDSEKEFLKEMIALSDDDQVLYSKDNVDHDILTNNPDSALLMYRRRVGLLYLQETGIVILNTRMNAQFANEDRYAVRLELRLTTKGIKWIRYIKETNWLDIE